jgi:Ni,Fe-hydrogenase I large subunit
MPQTVTIDPITRIEGHLAIRVEVENNRVVKAYSTGEMFRGFEMILKGRDPLDAQQITQRICGVCPISHGMASIFAQDQAYGIAPPENGRLVRNLILGANYIQSHIIHFYHLSALDFVDIAAITKYRGNDSQLNSLKDWVIEQSSSNVLYPAAPFLPRYDGDYIADTELNLTAIKHYVDALDMRKLAHQAAAIFCGKAPHATALIPGGVTEKVTPHKIASYRSRLEKLKRFINTCYVPDVLAVASAFPEHFKTGIGCKNFLSYGVFNESADPADRFLPAGTIINGNFAPVDIDKITEDVRYSLFSSPSGLTPAHGETYPDEHKTEAYSWLKAPRYDGNVMEVGPLARMLTAYHAEKPSQVKTVIDSVLNNLNMTPDALISVLGRHAARAIECKIVAERCLEWLEQLTPGQPTFQDFSIPNTAQGVGLTEAPRGALGHWLHIKNYKIFNYQCVVPTTWNCSPRDDKGQAGPVEISLVGTPVSDSENPLEAARVVRSFDPCIACAVH